MSSTSITRLVPRPGLVAASAGSLLLALAPGASWAATTTTGDTNVPWYLSRATGLTAYLLLFVTVVLGLAIRTKALDRLVARWRVTDIHTVLSILVVLFVAVHAAVLLGDTYVGFSVVEILVPFASPYLSVWTGLGIIMAYLLLIIGVSFPARRVIGYRAWRSLHYLTFFVYLGALVHGVFTGTDTRQTWAQAIYLSTAGVVLALVLYRVIAWRERELAALLRLADARGTEESRYEAEVLAYAWANPDRRPPYGEAALGTAADAEAVEQRRSVVEVRTFALLLSAIGVAAVVLFAAGIGPFHWGQKDAAATAGSATAAQKPAGFSDSYTGSVLQSSGRRGSESIHIDARGQRPVSLDIQVSQARNGFGRQTTLQGDAVMTDAAGATLCSGPLASLTDSSFTLSCAGAGPYAGRNLLVQGSIESGNGDSFQGTLTVSLDTGAGQE